MYKCAFLGCGGRARAHARAYQYIKRGEIVALCDMNEELLNSFGDDFGIDKRYTDIHEMLDKERPDLLHIVTAPVLRGTNQLIRYPLMNITSEHEVPAAVVEKPIAVMGEDWRQLSELCQNTKTKFAVNTQLNFHPPNLKLKADVSAGGIGDINFIDASARSTPIDQGPHVLQLVSSYIDNSRPVKVLQLVSSYIDNSVSGSGEVSIWIPPNRHPTMPQRRSRMLMGFGHWSHLEPEARPKSVIANRCSCTKGSVFLGRAGLSIGGWPDGNVTHRRLAIVAEHTIMVSRMSWDRRASPKRCLIGLTMTKRCIPPTWRSRLRSLMRFWVSIIVH